MTSKFLIIENRMANEMLISEILSQLFPKPDFVYIRNTAQLQPRIEKTCSFGVPRFVLIGHHPPDQSAINILPYITADSRFSESAIYILGNPIPYKEDIWKQLGATRYLAWSEKASTLKFLLSNVLPKSTQ
ncbi:MAG: hypothetical protein JST68_29460 [Bacteroidetes bacterium]|nr:hypothetical protein [Bacteroidota bacterium]